MHRLQSSLASQQCLTTRHARNLPLCWTTTRAAVRCNAIQPVNMNGDLYAKLQGKKVQHHTATPSTPCLRISCTPSVSSRHLPVSNHVAPAAALNTWHVVVLLSTVGLSVLQVYRSSDGAHVDITSLWEPTDKAVVAWARSFG